MDYKSSLLNIVSSPPRFHPTLFFQTSPFAAKCPPKSASAQGPQQHVKSDSDPKTAANSNPFSRFSIGRGQFSTNSSKSEISDLQSKYIRTSPGRGPSSFFCLLMWVSHLPWGEGVWGSAPATPAPATPAQAKGPGGERTPVPFAFFGPYFLAPSGPPWAGGWVGVTRYCPRLLNTVQFNPIFF